jgi:cytochrome bd-type quinol oxidase subunit 2
VYPSFIRFLHILSVLALLTSHGVSMFVLYRIRDERDRRRILDFVTLSGETVLPMYVSIGAIVVTGVLAAIEFDRFGQLWLWVAIALLVVTIVLMVLLAKPYFRRVKAACEVRPSGVPRVSDEELGEILGGSTAHVITAVGTVGLLAILYLMIFKPWVL